MTSESFEKACELKARYKNGWETNILQDEYNSLYVIEVITPLCYLTIEAFIELADILMYAAYETDSKFDGFEIDLEEIKKLNKPWWKLW